MLLRPENHRQAPSAGCPPLIEPTDNLATPVAAARAYHADALRIYAGIGALQGCAVALERLAVADMDGGELEWALRQAGAAAAIRECTGADAPPHTYGYVERVQAAARQAIGDRAATALWVAGRSRPLEEAIAEALGEPVPGHHHRP